MRTFKGLLALTLTVFLGGVVLAQQPAKPAAPAAAPKAAEAKKPLPAGQSPKAKIKEIMNALIVPSSTIVFGAVATVSDASGVHELQPHTDEDWTNVLNAAVMLTEGANLLMVNGRQRELGGAIPAAYKRDWEEHARELVEAGNLAYKAAKEKKPEGITEAGERIDVACDECHEKYQIVENDPDLANKVLGTYKAPAAKK